MGKDGTQSPFCQLRICVKAFQFYVNFTPSIRERMKIKNKQGILRNKTELQNNNLVFNADPDPAFYTYQCGSRSGSGSREPNECGSMRIRILVRL
jgi:hypothetical protein